MAAAKPPAKSRALVRWETGSRADLDQLPIAHAKVGGKRPGRRYDLQQLNQAYLVALSAKFQLFCRDLHTEAVDVVVTSLVDPKAHQVVTANFTFGRKLDHGNPNPGNIASDFGRLVPNFWVLLKTAKASNKGRLKSLEHMNEWRNAIAHEDFGKQLTPTSLQLKTVGLWRRKCDVLARSMNDVLWSELQRLVGAAPW